MNSAGQRSPTRPLAQRKLALGPSETSPSPRRPALTSRRVSEPTGSPREGTSCLPVNCTGTGDRFPYPSPLRGKITGLAVFGSAASPTVRYFSTAAGLPAGVGAKTSSFRDVRGRDDHRRSAPHATTAVRSIVRSSQLPRIWTATAATCDPGRFLCIDGHCDCSLPPRPVTRCQNPSLVRLHGSELESGRFRSDYGGVPGSSPGGRKTRASGTSSSMPVLRPQR